MGYFSSFAVDDPEIFPDHSVTPPEQQLLWRLDDLQNRLEELQSRGAPYSGGRVYMDDDLRYEPVGAFNRIMDVKAAMLKSIMKSTASARPLNCRMLSVMTSGWNCPISMIFPQPIP